MFHAYVSADVYMCIHVHLHVMMCASMYAFIFLCISFMYEGKRDLCLSEPALLHLT
jgi:hypothetical protein